MHQIIDEIIISTKNRVTKITHTDKKNTISTRDFAKSIRTVKDKHCIPVIAEVKPSSPTTHNRNVTPIDAAQIARTMEQAGAVAISVLTEPDFFHGSLENLECVRRSVNIPVLRKDFIIDEKQLYETHSDLILLIAGLLGDRLPEFISLAKSRGLQPLVEVHNRAELMTVLDTDADIIGINNRNLKTMEVDLATTEELAPIINRHRPDTIIISESGIMTPKDVVRVVRAGADAVLVGTSIMKGDIYDNTRLLVEAKVSDPRISDISK
ncbi:MAG: indole-3-glycerol-phosphate synthase [ANME-2 cluster archaeon]|nr:indole-3-glycerol-phosphate synthase [ANME-2 cluster archaeon]